MIASATQLLIAKDLKAVVRGPAFLPSLLGLTVVLVLIGGFGFRQIGMSPAERTVAVAGVLWLAVLFVSTVVLNRSLFIERENGALAGLMFTGVSPQRVALSKAVANFCLLLGVQLLVSLLVALFLDDAPFTVSAELVLLHILVAIGISTLGSLLAAIASATAGSEVLLPLLLYPLFVPPFAAAVMLTRDLLENGAMLYSSFWFLLLVVFDLISVTLLTVLYEFAVKD